MSYGLGSYTRFTTFGYGWSVFRQVLEFKGIRQLEIVGGGCLKAMWEKELDADFYNIYVRANNPDIFHDEFSIGKVQGVLTEAKFRTQSDSETLLNSMDMIYVGVRAIGDFGEDFNDVVLYVRPVTMGENVWVNDRHFSLIL